MQTNITKNNLLKLAEYRKELYKNPKLKFLFFELIDKCNLNCIHCGSNCDATKNNSLPFEIIKKTLDEVHNKYDTSKIMICLTGGEPMLYKDIYEVIKYSKKLGFLVGITTNGTLIDKEVSKKFAKSKLDAISISLDGLPNTHDSFRSRKGAFYMTLNGIKLLQDYDIEPNITTVINKKNINELDSLYELMKDIDICSWRIVNIEPIGRAKNNTDLLFDKNELFKIYDFIKRKRFDKNNNIDIMYGCSHFVTFEYEHFIRDFYFQCSAGVHVASIAANGDIVACLDIERRKDLVQGNIYKESFVHIWENKYKIFRKDWSINSTKCRVCEYKNVCMGDSFHTFDIDNNEPMYCVKALKG